MFVQLPDEEKERLAHESGLHLEFVGLLRKCMYGAVDASARRQGHYAQTTCGSDQLEQSCLSHKHCPEWEVFCDADHAGDLGTRKSALEWRSCGDHI